MVEEISDAMRRLSCIGRKQYQYDPIAKVFAEGPIHYLIEVRDLLFLAWENDETGSMIVSPITRFDLDELGELGAVEAWTVLRVPAVRTEGIQFREIDVSELSAVYHRMVGRCLSPLYPAWSRVEKAH
jgi:hypothetical protein